MKSFIKEIQLLEAEADKRYYDFLKVKSEKSIKDFFDYLYFLSSKEYIIFEPVKEVIDDTSIISIDFYIMDGYSKLWITTYSFEDFDGSIESQTNLFDRLYGL